MSSLASSRAHRKKQRRSTDRTFIYALIGFTVLVIGLVVVLNWFGNRPRVSTSAPGAPVDAAKLLPLADPVSPIHGFHDMPRIPQGSPPTRVAAADAPQANLDLPLTRWDWGTIPNKPPVRQTFPIQNTGTEPLLVTNVVTSCGCTTADLSSSVIPPGQRADLLVTFDPAFHETVGPVTRIVWMETNDPDTPLIELRLDANVLP